VGWEQEQELPFLARRYQGDNLFAALRGSAIMALSRAPGLWLHGHWALYLMLVIVCVLIKESDSEDVSARKVRVPIPVSFVTNDFLFPTFHFLNSLLWVALVIETHWPSS